MSEENVEIIRSLYDRWGTEHWRTVFAEDVVWDASRLSGLPNAGVYHGHEGVTKFFTLWLQAWEDPRVELRELVDAGDKVVCTFSWTARGRTSGAEVEQEFFAVYELRDGKIVAFLQATSREDAMRDAGVAEN
jgi:ketosteroid isomerase-like protein